MTTTEAALMMRAGDELRKLGMPVTTENVEALISNARRRKQARNGASVPSPAELKATTEQMLRNMKLDASAPTTPEREVLEFAGVDRHGKSAGVVQLERVGPKPPAQQYAEPRDYFAEPRLSAGKKAELEAELAGLRTQVASPDLTPVQRIRIEQAITHLERILGKSNEPDARRGFAR